MGVEKVIISPDPTQDADVITLRAEAMAFVNASKLDALEALFLSGYSRDVVRLCAEDCGVSDADVVARLDAVEALIISEQPKSSYDKPPRGQ